MTITAKDCGRVPHRKTPNKIWKDKIRRACIDRVRQRDSPTARQVVQDTLREANAEPMQVDREDEDPYTLTEEEFLELLEEVEQERQKYEQEQLEEQLGLMRLQQDDLAEQINEFEEWEQATTDQTMS